MQSVQITPKKYTVKLQWPVSQQEGRLYNIVAPLGAIIATGLENRSEADRIVIELNRLRVEIIRLQSAQTRIEPNWMVVE